VEAADLADQDQTGAQVDPARQPVAAGRCRGHSRAFQSGRLIWENVEDDDIGPRHLPPVSRTEAARIMTLVADGRLDRVEALDWRPGYNP
jgi:hypothetical protein